MIFDDLLLLTGFELGSRDPNGLNFRFSCKFREIWCKFGQNR